MALQGSGAISLADIAGEFGGSTPHAINEYYDADAANIIPASGVISFNDFYGTSAWAPIVTTNLVTSFQGTGGANPYSFSVDFGSANANRWVVVAWGGSQSYARISSGTVLGHPLTVIASNTQNANMASSMAYAHVPTGSSGTISLSMTNAPNYKAVGVYEIIVPDGQSAFVYSGGGYSGYSESTINPNLPLQQNGSIIICGSTRTENGNIYAATLRQRHAVYRANIAGDDLNMAESAGEAAGLSVAYLGCIVSFGTQ